MSYPVPKFEMWLEFELYQQEHDHNPDEDFANVVVVLEDGRRYALNVWTFGVIPHLRQPWPHRERKGEPAEYVLPPDLLVSRLDRPTIERVIRQLFERGEFKEAWLCARS
ncbi:MAG: hypothetical protein SF069_09285 [Phycisphaerae bacterium]|nr:hypothetical protein [Phycisphaerae bacterium]